MQLEVLLAENIEGLPTGFGDAFRRAVRALKKARIGFAVAGALAYGKRVRPTYTTDIDLLVDAERWRDAIAALETAGFRTEQRSEFLTRMSDRKLDLDIDLMFGVGDPEESARETAPVLALFRTRAPVISCEYMLWMYLLSNQLRHHDRAINILREGRADLRRLRGMLHYSGADDALALLKDFEAKSKEPPEAGWLDRMRSRRRKA